MNPELQFALDTVRRAGDLILGYFRSSFDIRDKGEDNPVTSADIAADAFLRQAFAGRFPGDGWLSEETADDHTRLNCRRVWVVDPLDGTKEFVQGLPEFALSVALVDERQPVLAVVLNPPTGEIFHAVSGSGVFLNGVPARISPNQELANACLLRSRTEQAQSSILENVCRVRSVGSIAYKLALVAAGAADLTISLCPKHEWDICAGTLLVRESGGLVTDLHGRGFRFNRETPSVEGVVAGNPSIHARALEWIATNVPDGMKA